MRNRTYRTNPHLLTPPYPPLMEHVPITLFAPQHQNHNKLDSPFLFQQ